MHMVRQTPDGDIKWEETFEVKSLEHFAKEQEEGLKKMGITHRHFSVVSKSQVNCWDESGKIIETYHLCEKNPYRLI